MLIHHSFKMLLRKHPVYTAFNLAGLIIAMTACLLLFKYIRYEQSYDRNSPHAEQIWRVFNQAMDGKTVITQDANTHSMLGPVLKSDVPGVVDFARMYNGGSSEALVLARQQPFELHRFFCTDPGFLRMFPPQVLHGNISTALDAPYTAVIPRSTAERLFGATDALGQTIQIMGGMCAGDYTVTAVVADPPPNTHLKFDLLTSYATRYAKGHEDNFESYWDYNYVQLAPGVDTAVVQRKLAVINEQFLKNEGIRLNIQRFTDIHLHSDLTYEIEPNGSARTLTFLRWLALFILGIAFINYINLSTALANERTKEVGIRKSIGATRGMLTRQFLLESFLLSAVAFCGGAMLFGALLPWFGTLTGRPLEAPDQAFDAVFWGTSAGLALLSALLAGVYPAQQLAGFKPVDALRGRFASGGGRLRALLVVLQFVFSIGLIFGILVVSSQLHFLKKHDLGVQLDQVMAIKSPVMEAGISSLALLKTSFEQMPGVKGITSSSVAPGLGLNAMSGSNRPLHWVQKPDFAKITSYSVETDDQFFQLYGVKILAGAHRLLPEGGARFGTVSINKAMLDALGFPSAQAAIGQKIAFENSENNHGQTVGAVVENFHIESLRTTPKPTMYYCFAPEELSYLSVKIAPENMAGTLSAMQAAWQKIYPQQPFRYWFLDEHFARQYAAEQQFSRVFGLFASLALLISCLGLLGLTAYSAQRRRKEIGIRKVLGASVASIASMMTREFLQLVAIAFVIASPIAYYFMQQWLTNFAYRIDIQWWMFMAAGIISAVIAFLTVSSQSIKAALTNPVQSLRSE
jgi:putative ABC transport system permease protein